MLCCEPALESLPSGCCRNLLLSPKGQLFRNGEKRTVFFYSFYPPLPIAAHFYHAVSIVWLGSAAGRCFVLDGGNVSCQVRLKEKKKKNGRCGGFASQRPTKHIYVDYVVACNMCTSPTCLHVEITCRPSANMLICTHMCT